MLKIDSQNRRSPIPLFASTRPEGPWNGDAGTLYQVRVELESAGAVQHLTVEVAGADEDHATDLVLEMLEQARIVGARAKTG